MIGDCILIQPDAVGVPCETRFELIEEGHIEDGVLNSRQQAWEQIAERFEGAIR